MDPIAECAERALHDHPHPALRLSELVELVAERMDRSLDGARLRALLESHPERFRVLDPWRGPWRFPSHRGGDHDRPRDVWVVGVGEPGDRPDPSGGAALKLRESVRWLARGVDARSPQEVSRWYAFALAERALREVMEQRAA